MKLNQNFNNQGGMIALSEKINIDNTSILIILYLTHINLYI